MTTYPVPPCSTCAHCVVPESGRLIEAVCSKVVEPIEGRPMALKIARMETYVEYTLPCGYAGVLWSART